VESTRTFFLFCLLVFFLFEVGCKVALWMSLVRPSSDSLHQFVALFQEKVELLQKLVVLHGADVDESSLDQLETQIKSLENGVKQVE